MENFVGEIRMFAGNFAPAGWMFCEGQLLPISEYETLFNLIGTLYGGDGQTTFALPDLRGRVPIHFGTTSQGTYLMGQSGGLETVTLTVSEIPSHNHSFLGSAGTANQANPSGNLPGQSLTITSLYNSAAPGTAMAASACGATGGSQHHDNFQPYLCVDFIISLYGVYPTQN